MPSARARVRVVQLAVMAVVALGAGCGRFGYTPLPADAGQPADLGPADLGPSDLGPADLGPADLGPPDAQSDAGRCPAPSTAPVCDRLDAIPDVPVIDGVVECGLRLVSLVPVGWTASEPIPSGHNAEFAIAWHADGVYFFVHVATPTLRPPDATDPSYCGDGVEVYLDADGMFTAPPGYDEPGTRQLIVPAPIGATSTRAHGYVSAGGEAEWAAGRAIAMRTDDGYVVEAFVKREDVFLSPGTFSASGDVGIDVSVNVATTVDGPGVCGRRLGQYFLQSATSMGGACGGLPFCDVRAFCTPTLAPPGG